jgi:hypothetical protein
LKRLYTSANGDFDLHVVFIEKALSSLRVGGKLCFIVSNTFFKTVYGQAIRAILTQNRIHSIIDFMDYDLFEDATNYSAIILVEKTQKDLYQSTVNRQGVQPIKCCRVCYWPTERIRELMNKIAEGLSSKDLDIFNTEYSEFSGKILTTMSEKGKKIDTVQLQEELLDSNIPKKIPISDIWIIAPKKERRLLYEIERNASKRLGDCKQIVEGKMINLESESIISDKIFVGMQLDGKKAYTMIPKRMLDQKEILNEEFLTVIPNGVPDTEFTLETALLRLLIDGKDIDRWHTNWNGELVVFPYHTKNGLIDLISPTEMKKKYSQMYDYFTQPEILGILEKASKGRKKLHNDLKKRLGAKTTMDLSKDLKDAEKVEKLPKELWWYRYIYRKNLESIDKSKILVSTTSVESRFAGDINGNLAPHNVRVYSIMVPSKDLCYIMALLNSKLITFYLRHIAVVKKGKTYEFIKQVLSRTPIKVDAKHKVELNSICHKLTNIKKLQHKISKFPQSYLSKYEGEEYDEFSFKAQIDYKTRKLSIQQDLAASKYNITVERYHPITSPYFTSIDKAKYAMMSIMSKEVSKDEKVTIPIPRKNSTCADVVNKFNTDRQIASSMSLEDLESRANEIILRIYNLNNSFKNTLEDFMYRFSYQYGKTRDKELAQYTNAIQPEKSWLT